MSGNRRRRLDASSLAGFWVGADRHTMSVEAIDVTQREGVCVLRVAGGDIAGPRDWGEVEASTHAADVDGTVAIGATARYDFGFLDTTLTCFAKSGIVILCTFNSWKDGSARADYFTREFLYRRLREGGRDGAAEIVSGGISRGLDRPAGPTAVASATDRGTVPRSRSAAGEKRTVPVIDTASITGRFRSCDRETPGFLELTVAGEARHLEINLRAASRPASHFNQRRDVLAIRGTAFGESVHGGPAAGFLAESQSSFQRLVLAAYLNKGLLAIDTFATFSDGSGRSAYRSRDHFYRVAVLG
jgi:hypothetical protein